MTRLESIVVVGAGLAGAQTTAALRADGYAGRITLLGAEEHLPYDRPPLSKELLARDAPADLVTELGVDVRELADELRLDARVTDLELGVDAVRVRTSSARSGDEHLAADAVVLAVGSRPIVPPGWQDALTLHTWDDAVRLRAALVPGARLICVGAGWIGAEVAGVVAGAGCRVSVVEAATTPLERQLGPDVGQHLAPWYAARGVELRLEAPVTAIRGRARADGARGAGEVELASGEVLVGDVVIAAVGARPSTDWLRDTLPMDARGSLHGDALGRVMPRVYAVGDCVTRHATPFGDVPGGHWSAALHDPATTVAALLDDFGRDPVAIPGDAARRGAGAPYVFSRQLGHDLSLFGAPSSFDEVVLRGVPGVDPGWTALYVATDTSDAGSARLTGVLVVDAHREVGAARRLLSDGFPLIDLDAATDPSRPLRDAVRPAP